MKTTQTLLLLVASAFFPAALSAQSVVTEDAAPGSRNTRVVYYDDRFLFMTRDYGDHRDFHGNTEPGFFVHSKAHGRWLQILRQSTKDAKFGKSQPDSEQDIRRLVRSSVSWDFTSSTSRSWIDLPLKTSGSIAFPDKIEFDVKGDRYKMSYFANWKIESVVTVLYVSRKDLKEQFDRVPNH